MRITLDLTPEEISDLDTIIEVGVAFYQDTEESNPEFWERILTVAETVDAAVAEAVSA